MKQLRGGIENPEWNQKMVRDLSFIKRKLRYPFSRKTMLPLAAIGYLLPMLCFTIYFGIFRFHTSDVRQWPKLLFMAVVLLGPLLLARRHWQTLRFKAIITPYYSTDNQILLLRFLQAQHFAFARHPDAPEVFQIMSKNISALNDEREIVVFIADDKRILINSHFTQTGSTFTIGEAHHIQIARMLQAWLNAGGNQEKAGLTHASF